MSGRASVSVVVPVYNQAEILPVTLPAITALEAVNEIFFVNDGSRDTTASLLEEAALSSPRVQVLHHTVNRGRAAARNTGISASRGEIILFLDSDVIPERDVVQHHVRRYEDPQVVGVLSNNQFDVLDGRDPFHRYLIDHTGPTNVEADDVLDFKYFITTYISVRRAVLEEVGTFDERITYGEDLDLAYRIWQHWPDGLRFEPRAVVHQRGIGNLDDRTAGLRQFGQNLSYLLSKHPGLADHADLPLVDSLIARLLLRRGVASVARSMLPVAPGPVQTHLVRLILASAVIDGYRTGPS